MASTSTLLLDVAQKLSNIIYACQISYHNVLYTQMPHDNVPAQNADTTIFRDFDIILRIFIDIYLQYNALLSYWYIYGKIWNFISVADKAYLHIDAREMYWKPYYFL